MQILFSARGLATLAWTSTFAVLWAQALGLFKEAYTFQILTLLVFSLLLAILASASASQKK